MRWLCRIFDHAWGGTTFDEEDTHFWRHRCCRRCDAQEWTTILRSQSPPDTSPEV